ncbi:MAG: NAD(P)/FAD-dependent oxidoreductase [Parvibaculum sp.]|uniref:flavin-containing monooxygenase n=1 Tax=Parvibaculum sp. TaxID=2024848 RepID=UPI0025CEAA8C|nr:NAD(P)/FAD-dependent oxidoreductase [Parvibaculum sp.]MCE9648995.1 NAD(P)/FAD-dependent oxidoreductase [Parvibaculum sp.]
MATARHLRIAVIGAGASGLMALIKLREAGIADVTVFEKAETLGGTWRDNRYPGLTCDVPSLAYRYSFAPNSEWTHVCAPGPEILEYLKRIAGEYDLERDIRYGCEVLKADFENGQWRIETSDGDEGAFDAVLAAAGVLHHPALPDIPGLDTFAGDTFHTARWPHGFSLEGKRVGLIGTGSTATQITGAIVDEVEKLSLFQRTAQWILPLANDPIPEEQRKAYRANPALLEEEFERLSLEQTASFAAAVVGENPRAYAALERYCREHLELVTDPDLKRRLTPDYKVGCKRLIMSGNFYKAIQKPNAELVTDGIAGIEPEGVRTADGRLHEIDVLVLATGFDAHKIMSPMIITGRGGKRLDAEWAEAQEAYLAVTIPDFPNWFMIGGPNSPVGNFSWLQTAELQFGYALKLIEMIRAGNAREIAPRHEALRAFNDAVKAKMPDTIWASGCKSWYINKDGHVASWPWTFDKFKADMSEPVLADYDIA